MIEATAKVLTEQPEVLGPTLREGLIYVMVIPCLLILIVALLRSIASGRELTLESSSEISVDLLFVSIGAAGNAFRTANLQPIWGVSAVTMLFLVIVLDLLFAIFLLYARRFYPPPTLLRSFTTLGVSSTTIVFTGIITKFGK